jgi:ATP-dependent DNA helicase 2 subunit 1
MCHASGTDICLSALLQHVLPRPEADEEDNTEQMPDVITELDSLVQEMKIREMAKRSVFSIPMQLAEGFTIGIKG